MPRVSSLPGIAAAVFCLLFCSRLPALEKWQIRYLHDRNDSTLVLTDFKFPSARRGIAAGFISKKAHNLVIGDREIREGAVLLTSDSGKTWTQVAVKPIANSLFFLDDSIGWMVADGGIWYTDEAGRTWRQISAQQKLRRVYFFSATHGFAAGVDHLPLETNDGGKTWTSITVSPVVPRNVKKSRYRTVYREIGFDAAGNGIIAGEIFDPEADEDFEPDWMQPEHAGRRWHNQVNVFLITHDGGKTWQRTVRALYGCINRIVAPLQGLAFAIWEYPQFYPWATDLSQFDLASNWNTQLKRDVDRAFTDVLQIKGGDAYLAGYQTPGHVHPSPIPGKLKISRSSDLMHWTDIAVDYRAVARQVWLASAGGSGVWAATDTGMILKLETR